MTGLDIRPPGGTLAPKTGLCSRLAEAVASTKPDSPHGRIRSALRSFLANDEQAATSWEPPEHAPPTGLYGPHGYKPAFNNGGT